MSAQPRSQRTEWILVAVCLVATAISGLRAVGGHLIMPRMVPWFLSQLSDPLHWVAWAMCAPLLARVIDRNPVADTRPLLVVRAHLPYLLVLSTLIGFIQSGSMYWLRVHFDITPEMAARMRWNPPVAITGAALNAVWDYLVLVGLASVAQYRRDLEARRAQAMELERTLTVSRLETLRARLHPHFLFNVLHSTALLTRSDPEAARSMLMRLSDLLRRILGSDSQLEVSLADELDLLDRYLEIERTRFGDRLTVQYDVDELALGCMVPSLILQPIAENAIRHGISNRAGPGQVVVRARASKENLVMEIQDDGPGMAQTGSDRGGIGLANVRDRLATAYGSLASLTVASTGSSGTTIRIAMPARTVVA
jgi:hypothetical protein